MSRCGFALVLTAGIVGWSTGCGGRTPPQDANHSASTANRAAESSDATKPPAVAETKSTPPKIDEDSAAGAVQRTLKALEAGNLAEAYEFLPPSYQADIDGLVHEFAEQMDPEVWSRLNATLRKFIQVLRTKKNFIFHLDLFRDRPEAEPYRAQWDSTLELINAIVESDVTELAKLKQVTAKSLLSGTSLPGLRPKTGSDPLPHEDSTNANHNGKGSDPVLGQSKLPALPNFDTLGRAIGADLSRQFAGVTVTPLRVNGDEQIVALRSPTDEKPIEIVYIKHDGHWLPKSLIENWQQGIADDRAWLKAFPERIRAVKPLLLDATSRADDILDQLLAANNREQFEQAAGPAILLLATEWPKLQRLTLQTVVGSNVNSNVTISINRELTEREQTRLVMEVLKPLSQSGSDYTMLSNDGRTFCRVLRVSDIPALQASLATHFSLPPDDISFDKRESAIQIKLAP